MVRDNGNSMRFMKNNSNSMVTLILVFDFSDNVQRVFQNMKLTKIKRQVRLIVKNCDH